MNLEILTVVFIIVTSVAVVVQMAVLVAMFTVLKKTSARLESVVAKFEESALPTLRTAQSMLQEYRPKLDQIILDAVASTAAAKEQLVRVDAVLNDVLDRVRLQVIRTDEFFSRSLDKLEDATELVHHSVVSPVRQASGFVQGVSAGIATLLHKGRYSRAKNGPGMPKEDMFI